MVHDAEPQTARDRLVHQGDSEVEHVNLRITLRASKDIIQRLALGCLLPFPLRPLEPRTLVVENAVGRKAFRLPAIGDNARRHSLGVAIPFGYVRCSRGPYAAAAVECNLLVRLWLLKPELLLERGWIKTERAPGS